MKPDMEPISDKGPEHLPTAAQGRESRCVQTVRGPIQPEQLGFCQAHEHLFVCSETAAARNPDLLLDSYADTLRELVAYRAAGGAALVDAQPVGSGRRGAWLARVSRESGVHVIAATGFHRPLFYPADHWVFHAPLAQLQGLFVRELRESMVRDDPRQVPEIPLAGTEPAGLETVDAQAGRGERAAPRAGMLKVAAGPEGLRESTAIGRLFLAAAGAAAQTRAPVLIHTEEGRQGEALAAFFLEHGVAASQLIFSHLDKKPDNAREMLSVLSMGAWVCLDTILRPHVVSDDAEIALIRTLIEAGCRDRLLMGLDVTRARMRSYGGSVGLADLRRVFLPLLRGQGIGDETIVAMTVANPARALAWVPCGEAAAET